MSIAIHYDDKVLFNFAVLRKVLRNKSFKNINVLMFTAFVSVDSVISNLDSKWLNSPIAKVVEAA